MAGDTHTSPEELIGKNDIGINDKIMVTSPTGVTNVAYGISVIDVIASCTSGAAEEYKEVMLAGYSLDSLPACFKMHVTFTNANSYGDSQATPKTYPKLRIKNSAGTVLRTCDICDSRGHTAGKGNIAAGDEIDFEIVSTKAKTINTDVRQVENGLTICKRIKTTT